MAIKHGLASQITEIIEETLNEKVMGKRWSLDITLAERDKARYSSIGKQEEMIQKFGHKFKVSDEILELRDVKKKARPGLLSLGEDAHDPRVSVDDSPPKI